MYDHKPYKNQQIKQQSTITLASIVKEYIYEFFYIVQIGLDFNRLWLFLNLAFASNLPCLYNWQNGFMIIQNNWCLAQNRRLIFIENINLRSYYKQNLIQEKHYSNNKNYME